MSRNNDPTKLSGVTRLPFHSVRHISCPEDTENNRRVYVGHAPIKALVDLATDEDVRTYLLEAEGKKRRRPTQVHRAIFDTLQNYSHNFSVLNSGVVIVARDCQIDEKEKCLILQESSIVNGAQTQGVIRDFLKKSNGDLPLTHVKFELIVTSDEELIAEIAIARNFQNDVMSLSIAGRLGELDELGKAYENQCAGKKLQKSETNLSEDYTKTERLLQVITALIPEELWTKDKDSEHEINKVYTYSQKAKCLREFREVHRRVKDEKDPENGNYKRLYQFYIDIVGEADELYNKWKQHQGFQGSGLHAIKRNEKGEIIDVPDGIVFPILASLSAFAKKTERGWSIVCPRQFNDEELIRVAKTAYTEIAKSNPNKMGKTKACYSALYEITSLYKKLTSN
jgi:hypothetical protein